MTGNAVASTGGEDSTLIELVQHKRLLPHSNTVSQCRLRLSQPGTKPWIRSPFYTVVAFLRSGAGIWVICGPMHRLLLLVLSLALLWVASASAATAIVLEITDTCALRLRFSHLRVCVPDFEDDR